MHLFASTLEVHMSEVSNFSTLGEVVETAHQAAVQQWVRDHRKGQDPELFLSSNLQEVTTTFTVGHLGYFAVWVSISAKSTWMDDSYGFRALKLAPNRFLPKLHSLTP